MKNVNRLTLKLTTGALLLALGILLPMIFHGIAKAGAILSPMHIPVMLCGFVCGPVIGAVVGALTPLLSSVMTGMPAIMPSGASMAVELAVYAAVSGLIFRLALKNDRLKKVSIIVALVAAMLAGRMVGGVSSAIFYTAMGLPYSFRIFVTAAFVTSLPGIALQFMIIPTAVYTLDKAHILQKYLPPKGDDKTAAVMQAEGESERL